MAFSGALAGFSGFAASPEDVFAMGGPAPLEPGRAAPGGTLPLAAPAAPQPTSEIATTGRGSLAFQAREATLGDLLGQRLSVRGVTDFLAVLDASVDTPAEDFLSATEEDLTNALAMTTVDGQALTAMARAGVIRVVRNLFEESGFEAPLLGTVARRPAPALPAPTPAAPSSALATIEAWTPPDGELVSLAQYVDQASRQHARRLTFEEIRTLRAAYVAACGAPPPEEHLPTTEQLAALRHLLQTGRAPYVDFAVWSPLGPRLAKFRRLEAAVLVGGAFVTKPLEAPPSYDAWEESFQLFTVAMVTLAAASPAALHSYFMGIRKLCKLFPGKWGAIAAQDLIVRSERWARLREDLALTGRPAPAAPWDYVITESAFGAGGMGDVWWHLNFVLPLTVHVPLEHMGLPGAPSASSSSRDRQARSKRPASGPPRQQESRGKITKPADAAGQICILFNTKSPPCDAEGACPRGRRHVCSVCEGNHPAVAEHPEFRDPRKDMPAKGKGRKGNGTRK